MQLVRTAYTYGFKRSKSMPGAGQSRVNALAERAQSIRVTRDPLDKANTATRCPALCAGLKYWVPRTNGTRHRIDIDYKALGVYTGTRCACKDLQSAFLICRPL